jgi:cellulose synthase/poly-beta-1,6-N-acetylglucosamine synthase-like glycosyltransferase
LGHLNQDYSLLTKIRRFCSTATVLEHGGRNRSGASSASGTSGVWRRTAILDAGRRHDTLTEDLDLSYRAQLRGWRFLFLPDLDTGRSRSR